jgi:hypothetical protein
MDGGKRNSLIKRLEKAIRKTFLKEKVDVEISDDRAISEWRERVVEQTTGAFGVDINHWNSIPVITSEVEVLNIPITNPYASGGVSLRSWPSDVPPWGATPYCTIQPEIFTDEELKEIHRVLNTLWTCERCSHQNTVNWEKCAECGYEIQPYAIWLG